MKMILLCGGGGKRLWPISNNVHSKQFAQLFDDGNGNYRSMLEHAISEIREIDPDVQVTIAAGRVQTEEVRSQLGFDVSLTEEPSRRNTFPAISLAASYLKDHDHVDPQEPIVIFSVDSYADRSFYESLFSLGEILDDGNTNLVLMGIEPTSPSDKYGYIIPASSDEVSAVRAFREKPDTETAKKYIEEHHALWNAGVFACRLEYLLRRADIVFGSSSYANLLQRYPELKQISFDYAVVEKEPNIAVKRYNGTWTDAGTWTGMCSLLKNKDIGQVVRDDQCEDTLIVNHLDFPILAMGVKNLVIAASRDGILVAEKDRIPDLKTVVDDVWLEPRVIGKRYGGKEVLHRSESSETSLLTIRAGSSVTIKTDIGVRKTLTVLHGAGEKMKPGTIFTIQDGEKWQINADTDIQLIETMIEFEIEPENY
ncbi:MAG: mannose-1-phosphate guanylyltransferase [Solobacterium sp.]|jgi:mannose-1-phosphate guanylyltransferase|nr:mannose-1-phosphate guanylyltransferase [Solobacterium sp.]MBQ1439759.1 mannose-1-phosphate guanylyltransferase [Solobacterium sp.]